ncbi:MAG: CdaR family protein [Firmicutes bacterium]|nr:CdaR family protein [Bacillota bacterium]
MDRWLERDLTLKMVALVLSVFLWLYVSTDQSQQSRKTFDAVRPAVTNLPASLTLLDPEALPAVRVTVEGSALAVGKVRSSDIHATLSLKDAKPGLQPTAVEVAVPEGVRLADVYPQFISVQVEPRKTARVPVQIKQVGDLGADFQVLGLTPADTSVAVEGPASRVDQVSYVFGPVSLSGATPERQDPGDFSLSRTASLGALDKGGQQVPGVTITPSALPVTVAVRRLPPGIDVQVEARVTGQPAPGYRVGEITLNPKTVKVRATSLESLRAVGSVLTQPLDIKGASAGITREVGLQMPAGGEILQPQTVTITVRIEADTVSKGFDQLPVQVRNLGQGLSAAVTPAAVSATVEGPRQVMANLQASDIVLFVNAQGLGAGDYQLPVQVAVPQGIRLIDMSPRIITLTIEAKGGAAGSP